MTEAALKRSDAGSATLRDWLQLSKARIVLMILLTTAAGFLLASQWPPDVLLLAHTLIATALVAAGTNALNQYIERDLDSRMERTRSRPLPAGRMSGRTALSVSAAAALVGAVWLAVFANVLASALAVVTLLTYLFLYTPLKRVTTWSTLVGSVPGAIPPLIGWAAVRGSLDAVALSAFAIVFFWQMPHFFAIGWLYREDYARAGFSILSVRDSSGLRSGRQSVVYALLLAGAGLLPWILEASGTAYLIGSTLAAAAMLIASVLFALSRTRNRARLLFVTSIVYLPIVMSLLVLDAS